MQNTIAVGISDPTAGGDAVTWAMKRAARSGSEIVLVHVVDEAASPSEISDGARMLASELEAAQALSPDSSVHVRRLEGSVMWQLIAASDEYDLIVVGTHKTGFIHGTVYGSTSLSLTASAACPVVVVPALSSADPEGVVVGADDSAAGLAALEFAASEATIAGQVLTVARVSSAARDRSGRAEADRLLGRLEGLARLAHPDLVVRPRRITGSVAEGLVAASAGARLLVLGDSRTGSSAPPSLGVVCHDALLNIRVPTAIVHSADSTGAGPEIQRAAWLRSVRAARAGVDDATSTRPGAVPVGR